MKNSPLIQMTRSLAGALAVAAAPLVAQAQTSVQVPGNVVETGSNAWHYLVMEGESYIDATKQQADPSQGFAKVYNDSGLIEPTYGTPILATNTGASMGGALQTQFTNGAFAPWGDKVTYQVVFSTPGDYYLYMRFTMFENGGNLAHYINEDSIFVPPDFNKDPQTDWVPPSSGSGPDGGYMEGCCGGAGFLYILDYQGNGSRTDHHLEDTNYWEGNFHWNQCFSSQFLDPTIFTNADGSSQAGRPFHYVVTPAMVGTPQSFTIAYREGGACYDLFLFSTHTNMMNDYTQAQLDQLFVSKLQVQDAGNAISTPTNSYPYMVMELEDFMAKSNHNATAGFVAVAPGSTNVDYYVTPVLTNNTTASGKSALFTQTAFGQWLDKVNYQVQFATPGDYYLYMRFTMFENGGNLTHYINEDSIFVPPNFNMDPQFDWFPNWTASASGQDGGYMEGCCGGAGFLYIIDFQGNGSRTDHHLEETNYWEGIFHWNQCYSSQFLNPTIFTNADGSSQAGVPFHYVVSPSMVGVPQNFAIGYREGGACYDLFLFSTHTNLLNEYPQATLDQLILQPKLYVTQAGGNIVLSWQASPSSAGFILQSTSSLSPSSWSTVQTPAVLSGTRYNLTLGPSGQQYFRLKSP